MDVNEKPRRMDSDPGEENDNDSGGTSHASESLSSFDIIPDIPSSAPNFIREGICNACESEVDILQYAVQCFKCEVYFHAVDCCDNSYCVSAKTSFTQHFRPALDKTGAYENRFGKFFFLCDTCCTEIELKKVITSEKRVDIIDKKLDNFRNEFRAELSELKKCMSSVPTVTTGSSASVSNSESENPWIDTTRTKNLFNKKVLVVKKSENSGLSINASTLRKTCVDNGIQVSKSFSTSKDEIGLVVNSEIAANTLIDKLKIAAPEHKVQNLPTKTPTVNIVGVPNDISKEDLQHELFQQNPILKKLHSDHDGQGEGKFIILSISKLKNNQDVSKATVGISNTIREYMSSACNDRIYLGNGTCKIYDSFHVKRCFKCQKYGHISEKCNHNLACGFCAGTHETRNCQLKASSSQEGACCTNCKNSDKSEHSQNSAHPAYSTDCPILKLEQIKTKKSIPFYQK